MADLLGAEFMDHALHITHTVAGLILRGWIARPIFSRSQPDMQYFYVNGRTVRDKLLSHALKQAYHDVLFHGRHPAYVLYLELDPARVDVNAHPAKYEVRFRDSRLVHDYVFRTVEAVLRDTTPQVVTVPQSAAVTALLAGAPAIPGASQQNLSLKIAEQMAHYAKLAEVPATAARTASE